MGKDIEFGDAVHFDTKNDIGGESCSDFRGNITDDNGIDLNMTDGRQDAFEKTRINTLTLGKDRSLWERLGAGMHAMTSIASPIYAQMENMNEYIPPVDYAVYQEYNNPNQQLDAELAQFEELRFREKGEKNRETAEIDAALNEPVAADNCDPPQTEQTADMLLNNSDNEKNS